MESRERSHVLTVHTRGVYRQYTPRVHQGGGTELITFDVFGRT